MNLTSIIIELVFMIAFSKSCWNANCNSERLMLENTLSRRCCAISSCKELIPTRTYLKCLDCKSSRCLDNIYCDACEKIYDPPPVKKAGQKQSVYSDPPSVKPKAQIRERILPKIKHITQHEIIDPNLPSMKYPFENKRIGSSIKHIAQNERIQSDPISTQKVEQKERIDLATPLIQKSEPKERSESTPPISSQESEQKEKIESEPPVLTQEKSEKERIYAEIPLDQIIGHKMRIFPDPTLVRKIGERERMYHNLNPPWTPPIPPMISPLAQTIQPIVYLGSPLA